MSETDADDEHLSLHKPVGPRQTTDDRRQTADPTSSVLFICSENVQDLVALSPGKGLGDA